MSVDKFDSLILDLLLKNNRYTAEELGDKVGLSISAVQRRLKKLRDNGFIVADVAIVGKEKLGYNLSFVIDISLHLGNSGVVDKFKRLMISLPEVSQCFYVTGSIDFIVIVHFRDMKAYEIFSRVHLMDNPDIKQFTSHVLISTVKFESGVKP